VTRRWALALCAVLLFAGFVALGTWQVERRSWKLDLIERVDQRVHAEAAPPPSRDRWHQVNPAADEYRHVRLTGTFLHDRETLTQASTELGAGFWVLTPLRQSDGTVVLVNRGFVPPEAVDRAARVANQPTGEVTVTGLLRMTEPGGGFLRHNDAAANRWFSRDVAAIAAARGVSGAAPYFVDAEAAPPLPRARTPTQAPSPQQPEHVWPQGGLTVVAFHNHHLVYALTWYALALMSLFAAWRVVRESSEDRDARAVHDTPRHDAAD
jgi:surfeit locus 1 family protein